MCETCMVLNGLYDCFRRLCSETNSDEKEQIATSSYAIPELRATIKWR